MSKQGNSIYTRTIRAAAALVGRRFVTLQGNKPAAGASALGVLCTNAVNGDYVGVDILGTAPVEVAAAITEGGLVQTDADGRAIPYAAGVILGRALGGATAAGEFIEVLLLPSTAP